LGSNPDFLLGAARPLPLRADIGPVGQSAGQAAQFCLEQELAEQIEAKVRAEITERVLREARIDDQVTEAVAKIKTPDGAKLARDIAKMFKQEPDAEWRAHIEEVAGKSTDS
jgi:hypothetical protein